MHFKKLTGKKCYLSPMDTDDAELYTKWLNDLEVTMYLDFYGSAISLQSEKDLLPKLSKEHNYSIVDIETDLLIGACGYMGVDHLNQIAEMEIFIGDKEYWGKGYGSEAVELLLDYGFKSLNLHNIMLRVYSFNERALWTYTKIGFKVIGKRREALRRDNQIFDTIYMDILSDDYYKKRL
jgi:RimJ/RimL family protein N-acetyltransferase